MLPRKLTVFCLVFGLVLITGILLSQEGEEPRAFTLIQQIGRQRPTGFLYNAHLDQLAMVDTSGRLVLTDAATMTVDHVLYERGPFNQYVYSHDGNSLAVALERRIDIWNTNTGTLELSLAPEGVLDITGPLEFSDDDSLIRFDTVVPEPAATRVSENDTSIVPWLWDLAAARDEAPARFANRAETRAFPDYRYGFTLGPNDLAVAGLPGRLQLIDITDRELPVVNEIRTQRLERDPISLWQSMRDDLLYLQPINENRFVQIDTATGNTFEFVPGTQASGVTRIDDFQQLVLGDDARIIGEPLATTSLPLLQLILGDDYQRMWGYNPITVMLIDVITPLTPTANGEAVLLYVFDEQRATGTLDLVIPADVMHMELQDNRLVVRRSSGAQQIEIYDLNTGLLERTIYPIIPDPSGNRLFALNADGSVVLSDYERFDTMTGAVLREDIQLLDGFENYYFSLDGQRLVTLRGNEWLVWDLPNLSIIREETVRLRGEVVDVSPDGHRFLMRNQPNDNRVTMEIVDIGAELRKSVTITAGRNDFINNIIPSPDWTRYLVVYNRGVAIWDIDEGQLHYIASDEFPAGISQLDWLDNETAYIAGASYSTAETRIYGLDYHPSGVPMCLVDAYDNWEELVPLWERFANRFDALTLDRLNRLMCADVPETIPALIEGLTPTPSIGYNVVATRRAYAVPGVPLCITQYFTSEALAYADVWREISAGLEEDELAELEVMICEGLIGSVSGVSATATPDPLDIAVELTTTAQALIDNPPTPTLGAETTGGASSVMLIDAETGVRSLGGYIPPQPPRRSMQLVTEAFQRAHGFTLTNPRLSADGRYLAGINPNNYLVVYEIEGAYTGVAADATGTIEARRTGEARQVQLRPTATATFAEIGTARPTITPTITPTSPPTPVSQYGDPTTTEVCDVYTTIHSFSEASTNFAPTGTIIMSLPESGVLWRLDPATGDYHPDETLPRCMRDGNCNFSPDRAWLLEYGDDIRVTDSYGNLRRMLFEPQEAPVFPQSVYWLPSNVVEWGYNGYVDGEPTYLYRQYNPATDELSEPFEYPEPFSINELQTDIITTQPNGGPLAVAATYFNSGSGTGVRYYLYDRDTETAEYFARSTQTAPHFEWNRGGDLLYYRLADEDEWFVYDVATGQHEILRDFLPLGPRSNDGRYTASWITPDLSEWEGGQVPKLDIWDSETNSNRTYCFPETGFSDLNGTELFWSPDNRYIAYRALPYTRGDWSLTPTADTTYTPTPEPTLSLEEQYDAQFSRIYVLDLQTGEVVEVQDTSGNPIFWLNEEQEVSR